MSEYGFELLTGKNITSLVYSDGNNQITLGTENESIEIYHDQDCCESVSIVAIIGNIEDLVGETILEAIETTSDLPPEEYDGPDMEWYDDFVMWTHQKIVYTNGVVEIIWYGSSNGYYGVGVTTKLETL